jgi:putative autotransporter adhesin-like protein
MQQRSSIFWPLALIAAGVVWILIRVGTVPVSSLWALTYLWPFLLIGAGISIIVRPYWRWAAPLMSLLIVGGLFAGVVFAEKLGWNRVPQDVIPGGQIFAGAAGRGSGHIISQARDVQGIGTIHISYPANYVIRQGSTESLSIEADDNVVAAIRTQVVNSVLEIDNVRGRNAYIAPTKPVNITITVKDLKEVVFESAGELTVQGLHTENLSVALNGAGTVRLNDIKVGSMEATLSGVGSVEASGAADDVRIRVDGLGGFEGAGLRSKTATVNLDGLGGATVWADTTLDATVNGLGSVSYYGGAQVTKSVNGLGSVQYMGMK